MSRKLGLLHVETPQDVPMLSAVLPLAKLPEPPASVDWHAAYPPDGDALGNDRYGNCLPCAELNAIYMRRAAAWGDASRPTCDQALRLYGDLTGFNPATGVPDNGAMVDAAMRAWSEQGIRLDLQNLDVPLWISVVRRSVLQIKMAVAHFGPVQVSFNLPLSVRDNPEAPWSLAHGRGPASQWAPGSWGGHRVVCGKYDEQALYVRSWGVDVCVDWDFALTYIMAVDATISREWLDTHGMSPSGLTFAQMKTEADSMRSA